MVIVAKFRKTRKFSPFDVYYTFLLLSIWIGFYVCEKGENRYFFLILCCFVFSFFPICSWNASMNVLVTWNLVKLISCNTKVHDHQIIDTKYLKIILVQNCKPILLILMFRYKESYVLCDKYSRFLVSDMRSGNLLHIENKCNIPIKRTT